MTIKRNIASAIATTAILFNSLAVPAFAATDLTITGNGDSSTSNINLQNTSSNTVVQDNTANITNTVTANATTGGNDANRNTGGDTAVITGDARVDVDIANLANKNIAEIDCCNAAGDTTVRISGNGVDSTNNARVNTSQDNSIFQDNTARVNNDVDVDAHTGNNDANRNTGGDVTIDTGSARVNVDLATAVNANVATIGGNGSGDGGDTELIISGNGDSSRNNIRLNDRSSSTIRQDNTARITNDVDVYAATGGNDANRNTGGDVLVFTGNAVADVEVDNLANFNEANLDCGCLLGDLTAKISGNGVDSRNRINANFSENERENGTFQTNTVRLNNLLDDLDAKTGHNDANRNTGAVDVLFDPVVVDTGASSIATTLRNAVNLNIANGEGDHDLPHVDFDFDLSDLFDVLHLLHH